MKKSVDVSDIHLDKKTFKKILKDVKIDHTFTNYEVIVYANDAKFKDGKCVIKFNRITHAVIVFFNSKRREFTFEWGNNTDSTIPPDYDSPYYRHENQSWFGCKIQSGKINVKLSHVLYHAEQWKEKFGKGGSYPSNCRGYVDSVLEFMGKERVWEK